MQHLRIVYSKAKKVVLIDCLEGAQIAIHTYMAAWFLCVVFRRQLFDNEYLCYLYKGPSF